MSRRALASLTGFVLIACSPGAPAGSASAGEQSRDSGRREVAVFAGGCFWSVEANFERMPGVVAAVSGFAGGRLASPTYDQVVRGGTGHLEAVQVTFDPARISYRQLVDGVLADHRSHGLRRPVLRQGARIRHRRLRQSSPEAGC